MVVGEQIEHCFDLHSLQSSLKAPKHVKVNDNDQEFDVKFYFSVSLKSTVKGTKAAGKLERGR